MSALADSYRLFFTTMLIAESVVQNTEIMYSVGKKIISLTNLLNKK